jgi:hypothetical protein
VHLLLLISRIYLLDAEIENHRLLFAILPEPGHYFLDNTFSLYLTTCLCLLLTVGCCSTQSEQPATRAKNEITIFACASDFQRSGGKAVIENWSSWDGRFIDQPTEQCVCTTLPLTMFTNLGACFIVGCVIAVGLDEVAGVASGEGAPTVQPTGTPHNLDPTADDDFECKAQGPLPRYNFTFKNRVLPEHCEMIYFGSCRNTRQCQLCDQNRVLPEGMTEGPQTYCQLIELPACVVMMCVCWLLWRSVRWRCVCGVGEGNLHQLGFKSLQSAINLKAFPVFSPFHVYCAGMMGMSTQAERFRTATPRRVKGGALLALVAASARTRELHGTAWTKLLIAECPLSVQVSRVCGCTKRGFTLHCAA